MSNRDNQETKRSNELGLLSHQLQHFENASPGSVSKSTKHVLEDLQPNTEYFEDKSESITKYPTEWPLKKGLATAEKRLGALWVELQSYGDDEEPQSPQASSSGDGQNQHEPVHQEQNAPAGNRSSENNAHQDADGDTNMRSNPGTSEEHRGNSESSRENSASSEPEEDHWPRFNSKVKDSKRWIPIKSECRLYGCDFADISFYCEVLCQTEKEKASESELLDLARTFMVKCPAALESLSEMCKGSGMLSYSRYRSTHSRPSLPSSLNGERYSRDTSVFSDDLERDRREIGFGRALSAPSEDWQDIVLTYDPDTNQPGYVHGKIQMIIGKWIDVSLPSLKSNDPKKERHFLVRKSDHRDKAKQFRASPQGRPRCFDSGEDVEKLGSRLDQIKLHYCTLARQTYLNRWPDGYIVGVEIGKEGIVPWSRRAFAEKYGLEDINNDINKKRDEVGQAPIVTHRQPWIRC